MCAPTVPSSVEMTQYSASPTMPPRGLTHAGSQLPAARRRAEPERARGEPERQRREQADAPRAERPHGGQDRAQHEDRAGGQERRPGTR